MKLLRNIFLLIVLSSTAFSQSGWKVIKNKMLPINPVYGINLRQGIYGTSGLILGYSTESDSGTLRYNDGYVQYYNGSTWLTIATSSNGSVGNADSLGGYPASAYTKIADTNRIVTTDKAQTIAGIKTFEAGSIHIKDLSGTYYNNIVSIDHNQNNTNYIPDSSGTFALKEYTLKPSDTTATRLFSDSSYARKNYDNIFTSANYFTARDYHTSIAVDTIVDYKNNGGIIINDSTTIVSTVSPYAVVRGGTSQPTFWEFQAGTNKIGSVGALGNPEMNLSFNMDYRTGNHLYYDTTKSASWFTMNNAGGAMQYTPQGYGNSIVPNDMWNRSGRMTLFGWDTLGGFWARGRSLSDNSGRLQVKNDAFINGFSSIVTDSTIMFDTRTISSTVGGTVLRGYSNNDGIGMVIEGFNGKNGGLITIPPLVFRSAKLNTGIANNISTTEKAFAFQLHDGTTLGTIYGSGLLEMNYIKGGASIFTDSVSINTNTRPNLNLRKNSSVDGFYLYLTNTASGGHTWANGVRLSNNNWFLYNLTRGITTLTVDTVGRLSINGGVNGIGTSGQFMIKGSSSSLNIFEGYRSSSTTATSTIDSSGKITTSDTIHVGNPVNFVSIDSALGVRLRGNATVWEDLQVPLTLGKLGILSKPDYDYDTLAYMFPQNDTTEVIYIQEQMPHSWKEGSTIYPHVHVQQSMNAQATFKMVYKWTNLGDAVPSTWSQYTMGTYVMPYTSGRIEQLLSGTTGISGTGKTVSSILIIKLYRSDNVYSGDIATFSFDIHYERDSMGSRTIYSKD